MPGFPCDNSGDDFIPDEMYDSVRYIITEKTKELGRHLTEEEVAECFLEEGFDPPDDCYEDAYGDGEEEGYASIPPEEKNPQPEAIAPQENTHPQQTTTQQNSTGESESFKNLSPRMAEYWKGSLQRAQEFGHTATLRVPNPDRSTTTTTRFIFLPRGSDSKE